MTPDAWKAVIDTNLNTLFNVTKQVIDGMVDNNWGRIVNISSVNGQKGQFGQCNYSTAKAGLHGFTMALAQEVATKGVTVNTVSPGYIGNASIVDQYVNATYFGLYFVRGSNGAIPIGHVTFRGNKVKA